MQHTQFTIVLLNIKFNENQLMFCSAFFFSSQGCSFPAFYKVFINHFIRYKMIFMADCSLANEVIDFQI